MQLAGVPFQIVPVVAPVSADPNSSGKVRNLACGGGVSHSQIEAVRDEQGNVLGYELRPAYRRRGWAMLQDLYAEDEGENGPGWQRYQRYLADIRRGDRIFPSFPPHLLPSGVQKRMKAALPDEWTQEWEKIKNGTAEIVEGKPEAEVPAEPAPTGRKGKAEVRQ